MLLAIDIGNTNIVIGCINNDIITYTLRIATDLHKTHDQYAVEIKSILELYSINLIDISGSIISCVVPQILETVKIAVFKIINIMPIVVLKDTRIPINIIYDNIESIGCDRIVNCTSALYYYKPPIIIFDMGTATTISVIDIDKNYIGGFIIPGIKTSLDALSLKASQLPYINIRNPEKLIGSNTVECMLSGIINGSASMIDGLIDKIETELNYKTSVIATGGMSRFIIPNCKNTNIIYDEYLILKGLNVIYNS